MRSWLRCSIALALVALANGRPAPASAQEPGTIDVAFNSNAAVREHSVMVSVLKDGAIVNQSETVVPRTYQFHGLTAGLYDVRVEGDGLVTSVKRGVRVFAGQTLQLQFVLTPGQGARIVDYATGGLAREEVAARLARLDSLVADLQRAQTRRN